MTGYSSTRQVYQMIEDVSYLYYHYSEYRIYSSSTRRRRRRSQKPRHATCYTLNTSQRHAHYFLRETIFVIACLIVVPAFSVSFFVNPLVTHTFSAGCGCQPASRGFMPRPRGKALRRVISTPLARHCGWLVMYWTEERETAYLINNITENLVLVVNAKPLCLDDFGFQCKEHYGIVGCTLGLDPVAPWVQLCAHGFNIVPQTCQNLRLFLKEGDCFAGCS
jgi:hypothetical protein